VENAKNIISVPAEPTELKL